MNSTHRSEIFRISDKYIDDVAALSPITATFLGVKGSDDKLDDFSMEGSRRKAELLESTLGVLAVQAPIDEIDRVAKAVMEERLKSQLALVKSHEADMLWSVLDSPAMNIRQVFEVMPHETKDEIENITKRLGAVSAAHESWISCVDDLARMGRTTPQRQVLGVANQLDTFSRGAYTGFAKRIDPSGTYSGLHASAVKADLSAGETSQWLKNEYLPKSIPTDPVGIERYSAWARHFTGADLDLRATYQWGIEELQRINDRMWKVAARVKPGAKSLREVANHLDADPRYSIKGTDELLRRLKEFTEIAVKLMDGVHFEIDDRIKFCDVRLAPEGSAAAPYYQSPSEDLSRPGITWFPTLGKNEFIWWSLPSIWYHEAVPGHHLQCATVILEQERLSRFQRTEAWTSGYGEGWALYAERFMDELGVFEDPGHEMGFLSGQALRAARVVVDIGMHLEYPDSDGKVWNADSARELLINNALLDEDFARSEVDRYLGLPGQAISYKVGERVWMKAREDAKNRLGKEFSLKKFHSYALKLGPMGLDPFAVEMSHWDGN